MRTVSVEELVHAPLGPGTMLVGVDDTLMNPEGFLSIIRGTAAAGMGRHVANHTAPPSVTDSDEIQDITESLVGLNVDLKGATRIVKVSNEMGAELASLSEENLKLIRPDFVATDIMSTGATPVKIGRKLRRTGVRLNSHYLKNVVFFCPTITNTVGYAWVLENAINVNDDAEYSPDENGEIFGVEVNFRAHSAGDNMDIETGLFGVPAYMMVFDPAEEV